MGPRLSVSELRAENNNWQQDLEIADAPKCPKPVISCMGPT